MIFFNKIQVPRSKFQALLFRSVSKTAEEEAVPLLSVLARRSLPQGSSLYLQVLCLNMQTVQVHIEEATIVRLYSVCYLLLTILTQ